MQDREFCAAGRTIIRPDNLAGLNWTTPCENLATDVLDLQHEGGRHPLCERHKRPIFNALYERMVERDPTKLN